MADGRQLTGTLLAFDKVEANHTQITELSYIRC